MPSQSSGLAVGDAQNGAAADGLGAAGADGLGGAGADGLGGVAAPGALVSDGSAVLPDSSLGGGPATGSTGSTRTGPGSTGGAAPGGGQAGGSAQPAAGQAPGTGPIRIGYFYSSDGDAANGNFGIEGASQGDTQRQYKAIQDDLNKRGGILGRQVQLLGYDFNTINGLNNPSEEENKMCTAMTQDLKVFAVLGSGRFLSPCLAKSGVASVQGGQFEDAASIDNDLVFDGGGMLTTTLAKAMIERVAAQSYFTGWNTATGAPGAAPVKVGILYADTPIFKNYYTEIKKALRAQGITVDPANEVTYTATVDGVTAGSQNAVLRFASNGVTHVFGAALFFFQSAENQRYRPRYGLDSLFPPFLLAQLVGPDQLNGSVGVGWRPSQDMNAAQDPGPVSALATRCLELMRRAGEDVNQRSIAYLSQVRCQQMHSLEIALVRGGAITLAALKRGFDTLGSPVPLISFGERWGPDRRASNDTVADFAYVRTCTCYAYTKSPRTRI